ncbi:MAG: hypothetical protein K6E54_11155 [Bacteroidaceae bacterium]|nr:hypothetical protein [Bacteroidaceae bacterium]
MRHNTYFALAMIAMMTMANATYAQRFEDRGGRRDGGREMVVGRNGNFRMNGRNNDRNSDFRGRNNGYHADREFDVHRGGHVDMRTGYRNNERHDIGRYDHRSHYPAIANHRFNGRFDRRGYVCGWEGRVRHHNGRWGYYRNNRWYWYNRYFEPTYYFATPIHRFNDYYFLADDCYVPGWEGRVCYRGGRWGYLRGRDWYWYDTYIEPDYYFARPVAHFHRHYVSPASRDVVAAVAGGIVLGSIISSFCY